MRRQTIERLLPAMYQRAVTPNSVLAALLDVMETMHAPSEATLASIEDIVAPYRTAEALVPYLIGWVALDHIAAGQGLPIGRLRNLVARSAELAAWRGTARGLCAVLETVTGVAGFTVSEPEDRPFHLVVRVPPDAVHQIDLIRRVVEAEKPAATTCAVTPAAGEE
ncbi:MAG TPA: phage tail protein [Micromonosporaceae bacterium]|jgi:phage tail-like protein|nr:phage tail protein [Micromonosporaceae bacterium]